MGLSRARLASLSRGASPKQLPQFPNPRPSIPSGQFPLGKLQLPVEGSLWQGFCIGLACAELAPVEKAQEHTGLGASAAPIVAGCGAVGFWWEGEGHRLT